MKKSAWSDLPNAHHIDRILAHLKANPDKWNAAGGAAWEAACDAAWEAARHAAWEAAWHAAWDAAWGAARDAAWDAARDAARDAAWGAILALMAWDDCAYLLDQKPEHVKIIALLGHQAAILLEPAVIAMYEEQMETV